MGGESLAAMGGYLRLEQVRNQLVVSYRRLELLTVLTVTMLARLFLPKKIYIFYCTLFES